MKNFSLIILTASALSIGVLVSQVASGPLSPSFMTGRFQLVKSENFDEYMQALEVGWLLSTLASTATPVTEIKELDGLWDIKTSTTFKTTRIQFRLGVPFEEETADGRLCQSTITLVEETLVHKQVCDGKEYEILRKFENHGEEMRMTLTAPGPVVSVRVYKRI